LTAAGKSLRLRLNSLLKGLQDLQSDGVKEGEVVRLRIGAVDATMFDLVPRAITLLHQRYEKIDVRLMDGSIERIVSALIEDRVDCVIGRFGGMRSAAELRTALFEEELLPAPLGIACSPGHPLREGRRVSTGQLVQEEWILRPGDSQARIAFNLALIQQGYRPVEPVIESDSLAANLHMVGTSTLLTVAPRSAIALYRNMGLVEELEIDFPLAISNVSFLCYRANSQRESIEKLRRVLREVANQMSGAG
jgi:DNA-binding transcriptional LysR family regulator